MGLTKDEFLTWHETDFNDYGNIYADEGEDGTTVEELMAFILKYSKIRAYDVK